MAETSQPLVDDFVATVTLAADDPPRRSRIEDVARDLVARWSEPHRHYHTVSHLIATLDAVRLLLPDPVATAAPVAPVAPVLELAVWFHDAVYDARPGDDEEASATLAENTLPGLGLAAERVREVGRLVRLTATHDPSAEDVAGRLLCDADLSVLAGDAAGYRAYARAVRNEYAHVPEPTFRAARVAVLHRLVDVPAIYRTPRARQLWESAARANVATELTRLADPLTPLEGGAD